MIPTLIDKQDTFEIVRDQIAAILALEIANQQTLAIAAAKDPKDWKLRIYTERSNPWEQFLNIENETDRSPLVNVWFDNTSFDDKASNVMERQRSDAIFNIDCYGCGVSSNEITGGHNPGDKEAAFEVQKAVRLVRNILMAAEYTYLGLRGTVWKRMPQSVTVFQPQIEGRFVQHIVGARIAFSVSFSEFSPQVQPETLEYLSAIINRAEDGEIVINADYDYTI